MKVVLVSTLFPNTRDSIAGIFVYEQIRALRKLGVDVLLVIAPVPWAPRLLRFLPRIRKYQGIPARATIDGFPVEYPRVLTFPGGRFFPLHGLFFYLQCRRVMRKLLRHAKADVIHAHRIVPDGLIAALLGREFHLPVVCTLHGGDINDLLPPIARPGKNRLSLAVTKWALGKVDHLIAVSYDLRQKVAALTGNQDINIHVVHNGADATIFRAISKTEARSTLGLSPDKKFVLFVGYLVPDKGLDYLLEAFARIRQPDTLLYLVGTGKRKESLCAIACNLGIQDACIFVGQRPHDEIPLWLSAADCLVLSSLTEGAPTIVPEAMFCRAPIVATSVGGIPELIRNGETGLVVPSKDTAALARAINLMLTDRAAACVMAQRAEIYARANLTWDANARKTIEIYRKAVHPTMNTLMQSV